MLVHLWKHNPIPDWDSCQVKALSGLVRVSVAVEALGRLRVGKSFEALAGILALIGFFFVLVNDRVVIGRIHALNLIWASVIA